MKKLRSFIIKWLFCGYDWTKRKQGPLLPLGIMLFLTGHFQNQGNVDFFLFTHSIFSLVILFCVILLLGNKKWPLVFLTIDLKTKTLHLDLKTLLVYTVYIY